MRVAQVLTASTGGIGRHVASLLPRLQARGHLLTVFCPQVTAQSQGFDALGVSVRPLRELSAARRMDVVHAHGYKAGALAAAATVPAGPPLVVSWHNAVLGHGLAALVGEVLQRGVARAADLTLAASSDLVNDALRLGARAARLGPVAAPQLPAASAGRAELRNRLGWGPEVVVLTVGRLAAQKNLPMVLDVAAATRGRARLRFVIAGEGPEREALQRRIDSDQLPVELLGRTDSVADLLAAADVALLTSTWEARALVAQEALLAGLPLVATRVGGIEELVGDAAVLVELGDLSAAARAVIRLAGDPSEQERLSRAGRTRAATWPDEDDVADDVEAAYAQVTVRR
ncbi:MAG TPA: glycosyltransferase family 4 protein [Propionibacteriaceae bacterium]|nr:glycosyltransferase family 4 protein [Propionibacteriaceae bacterium]